MEKTHYKVSVVVCTYNRASILWETLMALADQTVSRESYEVVVVDNHSTDNTLEVAKLFETELKNFKAVYEPEQGLSHARNRGYKQTSAEWVAYLDDDARASKTHVEQILHTIDNHAFDCFGGVYIPWYRYGKPEWFKDRYASNIHIQSHIGELPGSSYLSGGNFVIKRNILTRLGGFSVTLGMKGKTTAYGEETHLQLELRRHQYIIGFDPELIVQHAVVEKKMSVRWFLKSGYASGRDYWESHGTIPSLSGITMPIVKDVIKTFFRLPRHLLKLRLPHYHIQNFSIDIFHPLFYRFGVAVSGVKKILNRVSEQ